MVRARGVDKRYGKLPVLRGLDLDVERGQVTAIVGPNASGKTTFNKILLGLVRADRGEVHIDGHRVDEDPSYRARIGYMPQSARFPENLCADDVFRMLADLRGASEASRDEELIESLVLGPVLRTPIRVLSGGMRQRVNAALAFLFRPELLLLDEPTAALDPISSGVLKDKIRQERDAGRTFILTSHVLSELEELADRVAFLLEGQVRFSGSQEELKAKTGEATLERAIAQLMRQGAAEPPAVARVS
ncbi:MAG: ABC transporter ATP-binding protein [Gemmatimonadetes bacterium]|nr:ABC transporter ATP-binding protein [Gemmatimonadota bacterium]MCC6773219.1 ABC transporter ATP-binding protein [Gemmatimonadaceae bacterium]